MKEIYIFNNNGQQEEVSIERWIWKVTYNNGDILKQFDDDGFFHQIGEIDQKNVKIFSLYTADENKNINIVLPQGAKIIHKYQRYVFSAGTAQERRHTVYIFWYKLGKNYYYNFIMPDDTIVQSLNEEIQLTIDTYDTRGIKIRNTNI